MNRRAFIQSSVLSTTALAASANLFGQAKASKNEFAIFTKPFQHLNFSDFADFGWDFF